MKSATFIAPADLLEVANAFGETMGWGYPCYTVPLSPTGAEPATHWAARATVYPGFVELLAEPPEGSPPFSVTGIDPEAVYLPGTILVDLSATDDFAGHFYGVIERMGLQMVTSDAA